MQGHIFPGQGAQFTGMGKDIFDQYSEAADLMLMANDILGFDITKVMFEGTAEDLKQTRITQPAIFIHSMAKVRIAGKDYKPKMVAGHSLGEFSALVANETISFDDGLKLVYKRAMAMQASCDEAPGTMAAVLGMEDKQVEEICAKIEGVVPANYNCPGQLVISGSVRGINEAVEMLKEAGARRALVLPVGGAFHSPLMESAKKDLQEAINETVFTKPICPIYQNVTAKPVVDTEIMKQNLIAQLTAPVRWTQTMQNMIADGVTEFVEVGGNGKVLTGLVKKIDRKFPCTTL